MVLLTFGVSTIPMPHPLGLEDPLGKYFSNRNHAKLNIHRENWKLKLMLEMFDGCEEY